MAEIGDLLGQSCKGLLNRLALIKADNIETIDDVMNYVDNLVLKFSPLIAGVGEGLIKTLRLFFGRLKRIKDRVELLASEFPEEIADLIIDIVRKITGVPSPVIKTVQHVHDLLPGNKHSGSNRPI